MSAHISRADALVEESVALLHQNQAARAELLARDAVKSDPGHLQGLNTLAFALHAQGKYQESEHAYLALTELQPAEAMHWMNVGNARRCDGRPDEALSAFATAAAMGAASTDFFYNVALAHMARFDYESARSLLERALTHNPADSEIRYRYALCCFETIRNEEALAALADWEHIGSDDPDIAAGVGELLMKLGQLERAEPIVRGAAASGNADFDARVILIQLLERTNRVAEARRMLDSLQTKAPGAGPDERIEPIQAQLAQREGDHELAVALFDRVLARSSTLHDRHFQLFPLAKSLDALGRYEDAFRTLTEAHRSQLAHLKLTSPLSVLKGTRRLTIADHPCDSGDVSRWDASCAPGIDASPIFIVAFPRSGTTLLELTLDAHPLLKSMDEQPFLQNALDDILAQNVRYPHELANLSTEQLDRIRGAYWTRVARQIALQPGQRLIDKNPLNILRLPVIKRLFPRAKVLLAVRHPCDVIMSCFMQHFRAPDFALLCTDLPTLSGAYCHAFDFWFSQQALLQANVLELRYELFVENFAAETRRVFDFLEVGWNDAVLAPATHALQKRFISTPSYSQVVQPITTNSVGRWRHYEQHLTPSLPLLQPYLARWEY